MSQDIWYKNPKILFDQNHIYELWPTNNMEIEKKLNSITRLIILLTFIIYFLTFKKNIFIIGILMVITVIMYYYINFIKKESFVSNIKNIKSILNNNNIDENINKINSNYTLPNKENPLMNVNLPELNKKPKRKPAAPAFNSKIEKKIKNSIKHFITDQFNDEKIKEKLFNDREENIILDRSLLNFHSTANTKIPSDLDDYKNFLYGNMKSNKELHKIDY